MNQSVNYWQLIAWSLLRFSVCKKSEIKDSLHSIIEAFATLWNGLILSLFLFFVWVLCITYTSRLCTKNVVLSCQGKIPKTFDNTVEEMIKLIVSYVRVSSREQAYNTNALAQQRERVIQAGAQQIFEDIQKGKSDKRPAFQKLMELVKRGRD